MTVTTIELAEFLPADAFDVTVTDYVARWKKPNSYAAKGYTTEARFLGASFLAAIRAELPALKDWQIVDYDGSPATDWSDRAALTDGAVKIWATTRGYGGNAFSKVEIQGYAVAKNGGHSSKSINISASLSRPAAAIAKDIARRVLPELDAAKAEANAKAKAELDAAKLIRDKVAQLSKRYPNLRITGQERESRVRIATKYGAGIHLDCYAYVDSRSGDWRLTSDRGTSFSLDKMDSAYGRAFLKLCNDN